MVRGVFARLARHRPRRLSLRARIMLSFAGGSFVLAILLASTTYALTRSTLVRQRDRAAITQALQGASIMRDALRSNPETVQPILSSLQAQGASRPLVYYKGNWQALTAEVSQESLPAALRARVSQDGVAARMVYRLHGKPVVAVGVPLLPTVNGAYFEIRALDDIERTLRSVGVSLIGAGVLTTSLGVLLGWWASNRALRPLGAAALAAQAIAGGRLDTRLEAADDPGLARLAEAFNDMAAALERRVQRDARFASDVSHELRSPLMTLSASLEVMQARRDDMPDRAQQALDLMVADVNRFQGLVEDLLEISRFDAGAIRLHLEDLLVAEFVRQAVAVSSARDAPVHVSPIAENMAIRADKRRLARAVANLVDNARVYGGGDLTVRVDHPATETPPSSVRIAVEDHGPGVAPEERLLVFERFARGTGARRRGLGEGAGLGLALVDEHVRLHGGRVWVEDRADGEPGARFVIELPAELL